jgi:hypothetical protein
MNNRALLHEVEEREPGRSVMLRYRDHKAQLRLDERLPRRISVACRTGQVAAGRARLVTGAQLFARLGAGFHPLRQVHLAANSSVIRAMSTRYKRTRSSPL